MLFQYNIFMGISRKRLAWIMAPEKFQKVLESKEKEVSEIKSRMYEKYPVLAEQYQYYQTSVCNDSSERREFDTDWKYYLIYLDSSSHTITFNQFFEKQRLYQIRRYKQNPYRINRYHTNSRNYEKYHQSNITNTIKNDTVYFAGVNNLKSLKKRYHDLLKIYHPDNQNGDSTVSKQIQEEYEFLLKKYK